MFGKETLGYDSFGQNQRSGKLGNQQQNIPISKKAYHGCKVGTVLAYEIDVVKCLTWFWRQKLFSESHKCSTVLETGIIFLEQSQYENGIPRLLSHQLGLLLIDENILTEHSLHSIREQRDTKGRNLGGNWISMEGQH